MVEGVYNAISCIEGMVNVCVNNFRTSSRNNETPEHLRKELKKYVKSYKGIILGEKERKTKYWFVIRPSSYHGDSCIDVLFSEMCYPKKYSIKDKKIWWFPSLNCGKHEDELFETYDEAKDYLKKRLEFELLETQKKITALGTIPDNKEDSYENQYFRKKKEDVQNILKCGCDV